MNRLVILYGSQTGNAQDLAERVWKRAKRNGVVSTRLCSFDKFDINELTKRDQIVLGVCSTTGQGDVPDNMNLFWRSIMRKGLPHDALDSLSFAMIGLGDSSYEKYNFTAKKLFKRFVQLGALPLADLCLCDDQQSDGIEGSFSSWFKLFWPKAQSQLACDPQAVCSKVSKYRLVYLNETDAVTRLKTDQDDTESDRLASELHPYKAKLLSNERQTSKNHFQDVRLIELDCSDTRRIRYEAGDVLMMRPSNLSHNVDKFKQVFDHLNLNFEQSIRIESNYDHEIDSANEPSARLVRTVGDLVCSYFDLNSVPRMSFFETFSQAADDELEREKLEEFLTTTDGLEDLVNYCYRPKRTIMEIFYDFPKTSRNLRDLDSLLELIPSIKPRAFSIASSPFKHKHIVQLLVAVVEYKTRLFETRKGTCSYWLSSLSASDAKSGPIEIPVWIKKGTFHLDWSNKHAVPIIYVGPGTGVAPFRSIIHERIAKHGFGENYLYFGCRNRASDYYFENEWNELEQSSVGFKHYAAFSRDQPEKIYVQDLMERDGDQVFRLINQMGAYFLIAGNSKRMPEDVLAILERIIRARLSNQAGKSDLSDESLTQMAKDYVRRLEQAKRIQMETWS